MASVTISTVKIGNGQRLDATFKDDAGTPTDPTTVTFKTEPPAGVITPVAYTPPAPGANAVQRVSAGVYYMLVHVGVARDQIGRWWYRIEGTGAVEAADEGYFRVPPSVFAS